MQIQRTAQEEQLRQLRLINGQLNPARALLKFFFWTVVVLFLVFGAFGFMVQQARSSAVHASPRLHRINARSQRAALSGRPLING